MSARGLQEEACLWLRGGEGPLLLSASIRGETLFMVVTEAGGE